MSTAVPSTDAAAFCADTVRVQDFPAYASTLFAAPQARRGLLALHAFAGEIAQVHDHVSQPLPGEIRLQWWADALAGAGHGDVGGNPVAAELMQAVAAFALPVEPMTRMIDAWRSDLYDEPISDLAALEQFIGETTSNLLALNAQVCAPGAEQAADLLQRAGLGLGLVQVIAQVPRLASRGRLHLPRDLLALNAVSPEEVLAGRTSPGLRAVLAYLANEAESKLAALTEAPVAVRPALLPLAWARGVLARFRRVDFDPFRLEPPSRLAVLWTMWRAA